jgi:hypothetical protein
VEDPEDRAFCPELPVRTLGNQVSHMWLCTNRTSTLWVRLRHEVGDLDGHPPVNPHLLHHLVEEVFCWALICDLKGRAGTARIMFSTGRCVVDVAAAKVGWRQSCRSPYPGRN